MKIATKYIALLILIFTIHLHSEDKGKTLLEMGFELLHSGDYRKASSSFEQILQKEQENARAHYGLASAYLKVDSTGQKSLKHFKKAIDLDSKFADAHYQLALLYKERFENNQTAMNYLKKAIKADEQHLKSRYELTELLRENHKPNEAMENLEELVLVDPDFKDSYRQFVQMVIQNKKDEIIIRTNPELLSQFGDNPLFYYDLADAYYRSQKYQKGLDVINRLRIEFPEFSYSQFYLLRAKILLGLDEINSGLKDYWLAVEKIRTERDSDEIFQDLSYLMDDKEYKRVETIPLSEHSVFYKGFWTRRDPNLSTPENERIVEHYKRLRYALEHYRRKTTKHRWHKMVYEYHHPLRKFYGFWLNSSGEEFFDMIHFPNAIPDNRIIDDLGIIYIRHGEPDEKATAATQSVDLGKLPPSLLMLISAANQETNNFDQLVQRDYGFDLLPMNMSWKYYARHDREEMIFHFVKHSGNSGWIIESFPTVVTNREMLDPRYLRLEKALTTARVAEIVDKHGWVSVNDSRYHILQNEIARNRTEIPAIVQSLKNEAVEDVKLGMQTETTGYKYKEQPLDFRYAFVGFKDKEGKNRIEFYYAIEGARATLMEKSSIGRIELDKFIGFYDSNGKQIIRFEDETNVNVGMARDEWAKKGILGVDQLFLKPGRYQYELHIKDKISGKLGVYRGVYENENYWKKELDISDILLIGDIRSRNNKDVFTKKEIAFTPRMFSSFSNDEKIGLYFEIYDLIFNSSMHTQYKVSYTIKPYDEEKGGIGKVFDFLTGIFESDEETIQSSYEHQGQSSREDFYTSFDLKNKSPGYYEIIVQVEDQIIQETVEKNVIINLVSSD